MNPCTVNHQPNVTIRQFQPDETEQFLTLHEMVFGRDHSPAWFRWKFVDNPYVEHVPIIVATHNDRIIGCRAFFALEMRLDETVRIALQPCDTMVHPDYRRQGIFSRMNRRAIDYYSDRTPAFFFNFPNEHSKPGNLKHGWRNIGSIPMYYRPQQPTAVIDSCIDTTHSTAIGTVGSTIESGVSLWNRIRSTLNHHRRDVNRTCSRRNLRIERYETPPVELLETLYHRSIPTEIHANRTAEFYRWRLANPENDYQTYVAFHNHTPHAAIIVSRVDDVDRIVDAVPRTIGTHGRELSTLVSTIIADGKNCGYFTAFGDTVPTPIRHGFLPDTRFPLAPLIRPTTRELLVRGWNDGFAIENYPASAWTFSRLELDTS